METPGALPPAFSFGLTVIPTEAERSEAQWRDLFCCRVGKRRSLDFATLRVAPLGMTVREEVLCSPPLCGGWA
jgi:hypothetical protein